MNPVLQSHLGRPPLHLPAAPDRFPQRSCESDSRPPGAGPPGLLHPADASRAETAPPTKISSVRRFPCRQLPGPAHFSGESSRSGMSCPDSIRPRQRLPPRRRRHRAGTKERAGTCRGAAKPGPGRRRQAGLIPPLPIPEGEAAPTQTRANPPVRRTAQDHNLTFQSQLTA